MKALTADFPPDFRDSFVQRRGGWILSICLHVAIFSALVIYKQTPIISLRSRPSAPIRVTLAEPQTVRAPAPAPIAPPAAGQPNLAQATLSIEDAPLAPLPVETFREASALAATQAAGPLPAKAGIGGGDGGTPEPAKGTPAEDTGNLPAAPSGLGNGGERDAQDSVMAQVFQEKGARLLTESAARGRVGSPAIGGRISLIQADLAAQRALYGKKDLFGSRGADQGVIRELDVSGIPQADAQKVLERYGIKILVTQVSGGSAANQFEFLNRATTSEGRFVSKFASGTFRVFRYGMAAVGRMLQLEEEALRTRGLDPAQTRVARVVFGVVPTQRGLDLGVKEIHAEPAPALNPSAEAKPAAAQPAPKK